MKPPAGATATATATRTHFNPPASAAPAALPGQRSLLHVGELYPSSAAKVKCSPLLGGALDSGNAVGLNFVALRCESTISLLSYTVNFGTDPIV